MGTMGELVVLGWLTLELTSSPFLVGVATGSRALPLFFLGVPAGVLADRVPRHRLLIAASLGQALTATTLGVATLAGVVAFPHIVLLTFTAGIVRAVEHAARQSYVHDVAGPTGLMSGFAILGIALRTGWLVGSLGAGWVIARGGAGAAYLAVALSFAAGALPLLWTPAPARHAAATPDSMWRSLAAFLGVVRADRVLVVLIVLTSSAEILGFSHQVLLPSLARDILRVGPEGLGAMNAARAVGGILGLVAVWARPPARGAGARFVAVLVGFGASLVALALAPSLVGYVGVLMIVVVMNAVGALADLLAQSLIQLSVPAHLRGRAGGAWVLAIGLAPLGQLQIGALASLFGVSLALSTSGLSLAVLAGAAALLFPRVRRL